MGKKYEARSQERTVSPLASVNLTPRTQKKVGDRSARHQLFENIARTERRIHNLAVESALYPESRGC